MNRTADLPLFSYPQKPGFKERTTSRAAALSMAPRVELLRQRVLSAIKAAGDRGLTPDEAAALLDEEIVSIRPRFTELGPLHLKKIEKTNERRPNKSKRKARAWGIARGRG